MILTVLLKLRRLTRQVSNKNCGSISLPGNCASILIHFLITMRSLWAFPPIRSVFGSPASLEAVNPTSWKCCLTFFPMILLPERRLLTIFLISLTILWCLHSWSAALLCLRIRSCSTSTQRAPSIRIRPLFCGFLPKCSMSIAASMVMTWKWPNWNSSLKSPAKWMLLRRSSRSSTARAGKSPVMHFPSLRMTL